VREGRCEYCGTPIAGRFDPEPGAWGDRRQPVRIASFAPTTPHEPAAHKEPSVASEPADSAHSGPPESERPMLSQEQEEIVLRAAGRRVAATVTSRVPESAADIPADTAALPVYGAFVSLKRGGQLRSCCGYLGTSVPLAEAVEHAAVRAAKDDPRFPPISPSELPHLDMEVWLLWGLRPVLARGEDRESAIIIGKHGLQIARGGARGLLLPGVAVEHRLDAGGFLRQVCLKAGLPPEAWKDDDTALMTFEGYAMRGRIAVEAPTAAAPPSRPTPAELLALIDFCRSNLVALVRGATPNYYLTGGYDGSIHGLAITVRLPQSSQRIECSKVLLQAGMPLQATLFNLTELSARVLQARRVSAATLQTAPIGLTVLLDPALHGTVAAPDLQGVDPRHRAVLVADAARLAWAYDPARSAQELLEEAVRMAGVAEPARANVASLAVVSTEPSVAMVQGPPPENPEVRPAAVAGTFYPGRPDQLDQMLDEICPQEPQAQPESWPGVMVPHAGWIYSGRLAAAVFSRVKIPEQVIILCPNHRALGADWAVAPHHRWALPGREVAADPDLARRLAEAITGLELDALAHQQEHAIEVQLPLLARFAPAARVVGIAVHGGELANLLRFAEQMAGLLREMPERPLLVISSDMNHYADDAETRRLDRLALDAMESLDPARLYETVREHHISMCGVLPAVIVMETLKQLGCLHRCEVVDHATSADTTGEKDRVVGYAGVLLG